MKKGNTSFLSSNPLAYAVELTAESPLFIISNSGFGCSYILPLADCVKSAPLFNILQSIVTGNTEESFPYKKTTHSDGIGNARAVRQQRPFSKPEQTGKLSISLAHYRRGAYCERSSCITKQYAKTLAHYLMLGTINLCSSFCRHNTVLTWAQFFILVLRPHSFPLRVQGESLAVQQRKQSHILRDRALPSVGKQSKILLLKERYNAFVLIGEFIMNRLMSNRESEQQARLFLDK